MVRLEFECCECDCLNSITHADMDWADGWVQVPCLECAELLEIRIYAEPHVGNVRKFVLHRT